MKILRHKKSIVFLLSGLPGSGKSSWCKKNYPNLPVISRDIIRYTMGYTSRPYEKRLLSKFEEDKITKEEYKQILKLLRYKKDFIIDDTNLNPVFRKELIKRLNSYRRNGNGYLYGYLIVGVKLNTRLSTCLSRRDGQVPEEVVKQMWKKSQEISPKEFDQFIIVSGEE